MDRLDLPEKRSQQGHERYGERDKRDQSSRPRRGDRKLRMPRAFATNENGPALRAVQGPFGARARTVDRFSLAHGLFSSDKRGIALRLTQVAGIAPTRLQ